MKNSASQKQYSMKNYVLVGVLILGVINILYQAPRSYALTVAKAKMIRYADNMDIQAGDFIFQHLPGPLTEMIAAVTHSDYSHCGIVVRKTGQWFVLEAIEPVSWTPLNKWIARGEGAHVTIVRLKPPYRQYIPRIIQEAEHYVGRPYDMQYEWDDSAIYCSELIYKAVWKGAGIRLADFVGLGELNWRPYEPLIRSLAGGRLPLDRRMITPDALVFSDTVVMVYSSFPAREIKGIQYSRRDFNGTWQGRYLLLNIPLDLRVETDSRGGILVGRLASGLEFDPGPMEAFDPRTGTFSYTFFSDNHVRIHVKGRMDKSKEVIFGSWEDTLGFSGTFVGNKFGQG
jgi:hypothetical protein